MMSDAHNKAKAQSAALPVTPTRVVVREQTKFRRFLGVAVPLTIGVAIGVSYTAWRSVDRLQTSLTERDVDLAEQLAAVNETMRETTAEVTSLR